MNAVCMLLPLCLALGCSGTVNRSISVPAGASVTKVCRSVNGHVRLGQGASARGASTVNGSIDLGPDCAIGEDLLSVNGDITCGAGTRIRGSVSTVNGGILLDRAAVEGNVTTYNGRLRLVGTKVVGDLVIKKPDHRGGDGPGRSLVVVLEDGAGGSRKNLVKPEAIVQLLAYMDRPPEAAAERQA